MIRKDAFVWFVRRVRVMLILCSGYSGESEAFITSPRWKVIRLDSNPALESVAHTQTLDVLDWMDWIDTIPHPHLIWASPPCTQFSTLSSTRNPETWGLSVLQACLDIIDYLKPKFWVVENVKGAMQPFSELMGRPTQVIGPFVLWGRFPSLNVHVRWTGRELWRINRTKTIRDPEGGAWIFNEIPYRKWDEEQNAKIPKVISDELLKAVETYQSLEEWI